MSVTSRARKAASSATRLERARSFDKRAMPFADLIVPGSSATSPKSAPEWCT
jgi:hypothetical protein